MPISLTRRAALAGLAAAPTIVAAGRGRAAPRTLKISHQFPGGTIDSGDFRDRLCRKFAAEVETRTGGELRFDVYANSSLMKTNAQFSALRKGALDLSLYPVIYAGGEIPELNITFMPAVVTSYEQAYAWKGAEIGSELERLLESKGVKILTWVWQSGGIASRVHPIVRPQDAKGLKIRGGSREMDIMFQAAGAAVMNMPSNEIYISLQTGAIDAAATSSTSLISFRLQELSKNLTSAGGKSFFFVLEPLLVSKSIFDALPGEHRNILMEVGRELEPFGLAAARADDAAMAEVYAKAGCGVHDMDDAAVSAWREVARASAWKDYAERSPNTARFLKLAQAVA